MSDAPEHAFVINDLVWRLSPQFTLSIPHLALPYGQTTALLGRSASGKSTLLSLLGRVEGSYFERAGGVEGQIWLHRRGAEAVDLLALSERELIRQRLRGPQLGFVFQREGLFPGRSTRENISWPLQAGGVTRGDEAVARADAMLADVGLAADRAVATLSGGERKRLALARALAFDPAVLLLDEPLTGLDPEALGGLLGLLSAMKAAPDRTIVIVTHQEQDVRALADHVVFMDQGRVAAAGPRAEIEPALTAFFAGEAPNAAQPSQESHP